MTEDDWEPKPKKRICLSSFSPSAFRAARNRLLWGLAYFGFNMGKELIASTGNAQNF